MNKENNLVRLAKIKTAQRMIYAVLSLIDEATGTDDHLVMSQIRMPLRKLVESRHIRGEFTLDDLICEIKYKIENE